MKMNKDYKSQRFTDRELLEIFPEAKEIIPIKIKEWKLILNRNKKELRNQLVFIYKQNTDEFSIWFFEQALKTFLMPPIVEANRHILRLKRMLSINSPSGKRLEQWQEKIEIARHYPIEEIARSKLELRKAGRYFISLCPFHNERSPSFYIYPETNSCYCFGCQESGDVIKLTMHLYGINFKEAVQMLQN